MRVRELFREIFASAFALRVSSATVALIAMVICLASLLTVGRAAAADVQLAQRLEEAGSRSFSIVDTENRGYLAPGVLSGIESISHIERAFAFSVAEDVFNTNLGSGGTPVAARIVMGDLQGVVELVEGRWPEPGEGIVDEQAANDLGFTKPFGSVTFFRTDFEYPVVGQYKLVQQIDGIDSVLIVGEKDRTFQVIQALVDDYANLEASMYYAGRIIDVSDPKKVRIQAPTSLSTLAETVSGDLADYSTAILYGVLGIGGLISALVVFTDALARRSDLGRRMALGATRSVIVVYTVGRTLVPATVGALIGSLGGVIATSYLGHPAPLDFTAGTAVLTLIVMTVAAVPGALWAAGQDPVKVLRTP